MTTNLVTGHSGADHIRSDQVRAILAYAIGDGAYILHGCTATMPSANICHISAGYVMAQGAVVQVDATDLAVANGTQGAKRNDLVCLSYARSGDVESASLAVVQGTAAASPADPAVSGSILAGDAAAQIPLWRISLDGLAPTVAAVVQAPPAHVVSSSLKTNPSYVLWSDGRLETWGAIIPANANDFVSQSNVALPVAYDMGANPACTCNVAKGANASNELDINASVYLTQGSQLMVKRQSPSANSAYGAYVVYYRIDGVAAGS